MRKLFQFTLRDLFWLTLVVALTIGWIISYQRLDSRAERAKAQAQKWRWRTGALEALLNSVGSPVEWLIERDQAGIMPPDGRRVFTTAPTNSLEPKLVDPLDE